MFPLNCHVICLWNFHILFYQVPFELGYLFLAIHTSHYVLAHFTMHVPRHLLREFSRSCILKIVLSLKLRYYSISSSLHVTIRFGVGTLAATPANLYWTFSDARKPWRFVPHTEIEGFQLFPLPFFRDLEIRIDWLKVLIQRVRKILDDFLFVALFSPFFHFSYLFWIEVFFILTIDGSLFRVHRLRIWLQLYFIEIRRKRKTSFQKLINDRQLHLLCFCENHLVLSQFAFTYHWNFPVFLAFHF